MKSSDQLLSLSLLGRTVVVQSDKATVLSLDNYHFELVGNSACIQARGEDQGSALDASSIAPQTCAEGKTSSS